MISSDLWGIDQEMLLNEEQVTLYLCASGEESLGVTLCEFRWHKFTFEHTDNVDNSLKNAVNHLAFRICL